jgi:hypothetical protein
MNPAQQAQIDELRRSAAITRWLNLGWVPWVGLALAGLNVAAYAAGVHPWFDRRKRST